MSISALLRNEWFQSAGTVLSVLTLIGPDIIQRALAQLSGPVFTPVAFSFGWVAYAFTNLSLAISDNKFMPEPDFSSVIINGKTGYVRQNHSWILARILRDFNHWKPELVKYRLREVLQEATLQDSEKARQEGRLPPKPRTQAGLCVTVFNASSRHKSGFPVADWVYYSGILIALVQLGIAAIPWATSGEWVTFMITGAGILLVFVTGALPQWKTEKWGCSHGNKSIILTSGAGAQHALLIIGDTDFLDLEALATAEARVSPLTLFSTVLLAVFWIVHLVTAVAIIEDPWFLVAVGWIGTLYNIMIAGLPRRPEASGVHLEFETCIAHPKVMETLMQVETEYPGVGASILGTFFPGKLRVAEEKWWATKAAERAEHAS